MNGTVVLPKNLAADEWWLKYPFSPGQALTDLWILANDTERTVSIKGKDVRLKMGQLAHSQLALSIRWRCSPEKVRRILTELQDDMKIMVETNNLTTIITVLDYDIYNVDSKDRSSPFYGAETAAEAVALSAAETAAEPRAQAAQKGEGGSGKGKGESGRGKRPTLQQCLDHFQRMEAPYTPEEIRLRWLEFEGTAAPDHWQWGRQAVTDWRAVMETRLAEGRMRSAQKNSAPPRGMNGMHFAGDGVAPSPMGLTPLTLDELRGGGR